MLLTELVSRDFDRLRTRLSNDKKALGSGLYASVHQTQNDPNTVTKVGRAVTVNPSDDGYIGFVKQIIGKKNPYFPQISELREVKDRSGTYTGFVTRMEKLTSLKDLRREELAALIHKMTGQEPNLADPHVGIGTLKITREMAKHPEILIGDLVAAAYRNPDSGTIADPALLQAIDILRQLAKAGMYEEDIHSGNLMIRRTPYGPQLVITDPFSGYHPDETRNKVYAPQPNTDEYF